MQDAFRVSIHTRSIYTKFSPLMLKIILLAQSRPLRAGVRQSVFRAPAPSRNGFIWMGKINASAPARLRRGLKCALSQLTVTLPFWSVRPVGCVLPSLLLGSPKYGAAKWLAWSGRRLSLPADRRIRKKRSDNRLTGKFPWIVGTHPPDLLCQSCLESRFVKTF